MLVGHLGVGLAAKAVAPRVGLGTLVACALLLDIVLWLFVTLHLEGATVPGDFPTRHMLAFSFPWSHSLIGALFWSAGAAFVWTWSGGEGKYFAFAPAVIAATTFSHWILDYLTHPPELPLWPGAASFGLDLGQPTALILELVVAAAGLAVFVWRSTLSVSRRMAIAGLAAVAAILTAVTAFNTTPPDDILTVAGDVASCALRDGDRRRLCRPGDAMKPLRTAAPVAAALLLASCGQAPPTDRDMAAAFFAKRVAFEALREDLCRLHYDQVITRDWAQPQMPTADEKRLRARLDAIGAVSVKYVRGCQLWIVMWSSGLGRETAYKNTATARRSTASSRSRNHRPRTSTPISTPAVRISSFQKNITGDWWIELDHWL
ncbi:MAG: hypothetical protein WDM81_02265 [Rhizomicrobium sp.]